MMAYSLPYTPSKLSNSVAEGKSGTTHRGGQTYFTRGLSDNTTTTRTAHRCKEEALLYDRVIDFAMNLVVEHVSGLNIGVAPGWYRKADGTDVEFAGSASFALDDETADQKVYILHSTGNVTKAATWPADKTTFTPLAKVTTAGGAVTSITDQRSLTQFQTHASSSSPTGTTATAFTLDNDNAGAGVDQQVRFNRGSTNSEDAALEWDEANDRFNALSQHSTGTECPLSAEKFQVAGSDLVTSGGAKKVTSDVAGDGLTHTAGVLTPNVDDSTVEVDATSKAIQLKDGGITTAKLGNTLADKLVQISIPDASGASPQTIQIQALDIQGNDLDEVIYVRVRIFDDQHGATAAANATIAVGTAGTLCRSETAGKDLVCRTNSSGELDIVVTDGTAETVYVLVESTTRSRIMDCADIGTVVIS